MDLSENIVKMSADLGQLLSTKKLKITTAESCTGGGIAYALTEIAGSSAYLDQSFVTYSNHAKQTLVNVQESTLIKYGAVSELTVSEMAQGALTAANANIAIAVSGVAGPDGGSDEKPVGTVWFAWAHTLAGRLVVKTERHVFDGDRSTVRQQTIYKALACAYELADSF
ncbi:CinA family protein [Flocculibacter collagenilyticus]|uniref:CinA family protein n=1 Tax=Flocculibacter collagenilyticus TaxID=2744479 RepID=UPI0018F2C58D|nr:nicotinamide-nucleotide amidohydrolase family protein [Flocculibacter collagenilyticus]